MTMRATARQKDSLNPFSRGWLLPIMMMRHLFDSESSTYTYLIVDEKTGEAALIDTVRERMDRDLQLVAELGLRLTYVLDTHVHADHITAAELIAEKTGARSVASQIGAPCASLHVTHGDQLLLGLTPIRVLGTPGHTDDSVSYHVDNDVFTGDALLIRGNGRTDFQNGDPGQLYDAITTVLFALPDETRVWPAHDYRGFTVSTIGEERRLNPRMAGQSREKNIAMMNSLKLAPPRRIQEAVPANLACGRIPASAAKDL